jgi:hypothetical protein
MPCGNESPTVGVRSKARFFRIVVRQGVLREIAPVVLFIAITARCIRFGDARCVTPPVNWRGAWHCHLRGRLRRAVHWARGCEGEANLGTRRRARGRDGRSPR